MNERRAVALTLATQTAARIFSLGAGIVSVRLIAGRLGAEGLGTYNVVLSYLQLWIVLADFGLFSTAVRELAVRREGRDALLGTVFSLRAVTAAAAAVAAAGLAAFTGYPAEVRLAIAYGGAFIFFNLLASAYDVLLQEQVRMQRSAAAELAGRAVSLGALVFVLARGGGVLHVIGTVVLSGALILIFKAGATRGLGRISPRWNHADARSLLLASAPLGLAYAVSYFLFRVDGLMVYALGGAAAAGIYAVAYKVLEVTLFFASYLAAALKPLLARRLQEGDPDGAGTVLRSAATVLAAVSAPIMIGSVLAAPGIITFLSTADFKPGAASLAVLGVAVPLTYGNALLAEVFIAARAQRTLLLLALGILAVNVALNFIAIPRWSYYGAAVTTLLSEGMLLLIGSVLASRLVPLKPDFGAFSRISLAGAVMAGTLLLARNLPGVLLQLFLAGAVYVAALTLLGIARPAQLRKLLHG